MASKEPKFEIISAAGNQYAFRLKAKNGKIVAQSETYHTHEGCVDTIALIRKIAGTAVINDLTQKKKKK